MTTDPKPYPSPEHCQLIQFEGSTCVVMSPEDYEALFSYAHTLETELAQAQAEAAVMREALENALQFGTNLPECDKKAGRKALSTTAGKDLLDRLRKAESERDKLRRTLKLECQDWADDDTRVKVIAAEFGIEDCYENHDAFKGVIEITEEMAVKIREATAERDAALALVKRLAEDLGTIKAVADRADDAGGSTWQCGIIADAALAEVAKTTEAGA